mmetsp:Transcript_5169/g.7681  ORF Transcript_5169/g.7681 Transcript_5169/m.7681 type:complete len:510 (+) Transcript_5169:76-1605(+)
MDTSGETNRSTATEVNNELPSRSRRAEPIASQVIKDLWKLFDEKLSTWSNGRIPKKNTDKELDNFMIKHNIQKRTQVSSQLLLYKRAKGIHDVQFSSSADTIKKDIVARIGGVDDSVELICDAFVQSDYAREEGSFPECKGKGPVLSIYKKCEEVIKKTLTDLVNAYIDAVADASVSSSGKVNNIVNSLFRKHKNIREGDICSKFVENDVVKNATSTYYGPSYPPGAQLFFVSLEQIAYQTFIEALADHDKPELVVVTEVDQIDFDDPRAGLLYYLAGWLLFRVKRYAHNTEMGAHHDFLQEWVHNNQLDESAASRAKLPISIVVQRRIARGKRWANHREQLVEFPTAELFQFTCTIEATYVKLLTVANFIAYKSSLINKINNILLKNENTMTALKKTLSDDLQGKGPNTEELLVLLLQLYQRMRGRDIVRKQMSNLRKKVKDQQRMAHRDRIASTTNQKNKPPPIKKPRLSNEPEDDDFNFNSLDDEEMAEEKDDTPDPHILPHNKIL